MISLNGVEIDVTIFPDKTSQVWQVPNNAWPEGTTRYNITWEFENEGEIIHLLQLVKLIRHWRVPKPINLLMPYLPYGRQDKAVSNESTFALHVLVDIINSQNFNRVITYDAHSDFCSIAMERFKSTFPSMAVQYALEKSKANAIAFPDKGACDRYSSRKIFQPYKPIIGHKVRNQTTSYIEKYNIEGDPKGKDVLIVDDLCDGGMTFRLMTKDLLQAGAKSVHLYVSHGIFSKGLEVLHGAGIDRIFTHKGEV